MFVDHNVVCCILRSLTQYWRSLKKGFPVVKLYVALRFQCRTLFRVYKGRPPKAWNLLVKNCVFILTCFNFSHLQSSLHLMQYIYRDVFSTAQFLNLSILMPFSASAVFCFTSSTSAKHFPWRTFSSRETKKKCCSG